MKIGSQLKDAQLENKASDHAHSPQKTGMIWLNTTVDKIKALFGSEEKIIATEDWVNSRILNDITSSENGLETNGLLTVEQGTTPANPESGKRKFYAKADGVYELDNAGSEERLMRRSEAQIVSGVSSGSISLGIATPSFTYTATKRCIYIGPLDVQDTGGGVGAIEAGARVLENGQSITVNWGSLQGVSGHYTVIPLEF